MPSLRRRSAQASSHSRRRLSSPVSHETKTRAPAARPSWKLLSIHWLSIRAVEQPDSMARQAREGRKRGAMRLGYMLASRGCCLSDSLHDSSGQCEGVREILLSMVADTRWQEGKKPTRRLAFCLFGSSTWARTRDLRINSPALYRLSYRGITHFCSLAGNHLLQLAVPWRN